MKLYKFYKDDCSPCKTMKKIMSLIDIPEEIEVIELSVNNEENKNMARDNGITTVPALMFENGKKFIGVKKKQIVEEFIVTKGEKNAVPD